MITAKQKRFIEAIWADPKASAASAARVAGYSHRRSRVTACELLKNPEVLAAFMEAGADPPTVTDVPHEPVGVTAKNC